METLSAFTAESPSRPWNALGSKALGVALVAVLGATAGFVLARILWA